MTFIGNTKQKKEWGKPKITCLWGKNCIEGSNKAAMAAEGSTALIPQVCYAAGAPGHPFYRGTPTDVLHRIADSTIMHLPVKLGYLSSLYTCDKDGQIGPS